VIVPFLPVGSAKALPDAVDRGLELSALFREHHDKLVRFLTIRLGSEAEAQEAAQEAFLRLLNLRELRHTDNLKALLYLTARNIVIDRLRRRKLQRAWEQQSQEREIDEVTPEQIVSDRQQLDVLHRLIEELSPKCRDAFVSFKFHGLSYSVIASHMGLTESMVRKYVLRAVAYCAHHFDRQGEP
jgi:RNA polymerase sigma-70 factor (ECF subfamily)